MRTCMLLPKTARKGGFRFEKPVDLYFISDKLNE